VVLMKKFDAGGIWSSPKAPRHPHHAGAGPVSAADGAPDFDSARPVAFRLKFCTSAPFSAALKADVLARWPGCWSNITA
jgi:long-chain acyl-CoA synthetase